MAIETIHDFRRAIRNGAYAWPGGYPLLYRQRWRGYFVQGGDRASQHSLDIANNCDDGWRVVAVDVNWWEDTELTCAHGRAYRSAYGAG